VLSKQGYTGQDACGICHTSQHDTWSLTNHARAFETLVAHGQERNAECLACHTVGFGEKGGYDVATAPEHLRGVQCENCHGRGGPHESPDFAKAGYEPACAKCHTEKHSLRFSFADRLPLISHAANTQLASLSLEQRRTLIVERDKRQRQLFEKAEFVGSEKCAQCHADEHARWSKSPHANAFATLEKAKGGAKHEDADCQKCHTTGFGETGGFPAGGKTLQGVGCESCHGPASRHVAEGAERKGTVFALTDKCDDCVILQICGSCHDDANDPGFEFEVQEKIDLIRHGFRDRKPPAPGAE